MLVQNFIADGEVRFAYRSGGSEPPFFPLLWWGGVVLADQNATEKVPTLGQLMDQLRRYTRRQLRKKRRKSQAGERSIE